MIQSWFAIKEAETSLGDATGLVSGTPDTAASTVEPASETAFLAMTLGMAVAQTHDLKADRGVQGRVGGTDMKTFDYVRPRGRHRRVESCEVKSCRLTQTHHMLAKG